MIPDLILFLGLAIIAIASALGMLFSKSSVYSAINLIINFSAIGVIYIMLEAPFIAMSQIAVYTGSIMVLFLFVIMLLGVEKTGPSTVLVWQRPAAYILGALLLAEAAYVIVYRSGVLPLPSVTAAGFGSPEMVGDVLFSQYLLPFEITSILLLVSMIGAIVLTKRKKKV